MAQTAVIMAGLFLLFTGAGAAGLGYAALMGGYALALGKAGAFTLAAIGGAAGGYCGARLAFPAAYAVAGTIGAVKKWSCAVKQDGLTEGTKNFYCHMRDFAKHWKESRAQGIDIFSDIPPARQLEYQRKFREEFAASGKPAVSAAAPQPGAKPAQPRNQMTP